MHKRQQSDRFLRTFRFPPGRGSCPDVAIDAGGSYYVAWTDGRNGHTGIYFSNRAAISSTWGPSERVTDDPGSVLLNTGSAIAAGVSGDVYVVWADTLNGDDDIYLATRPAGGDWGVNVWINDDAGVPTPHRGRGLRR